MDEITLYFDRNFGKRLPNALRKLRAPFQVRWHQGEGFRQDMPDDEWLEIVGKKNWIVVTQDLKFHIVEHEIAAVRQHSVKCFYMPNASHGMWKTLCMFVRSHQKMLKVANEEYAPFIFEVKGNGRIVKVPASED